MVWTIRSTTYVFMAGATFLINASDGVYPNYYTYNSRLDSLSGSLLFRIYDRIMDAVNYLGFCKISLLMDTKPDLATTAINRCKEVAWRRTAVQDGFLLCDLPSGEVSGL